jgi:hypothetical protein
MHTIEKETRELDNGAAVTVKRVLDEDPDLSYLGEFTDKYELGVWKYAGVYSFDRHTYKYFRPANSYHKYAKQDIRRIADYNKGHWCMTGVIVSLFLDGVEISHSSLWGIESDSDESHFTEVEQELIAECLSDAKKQSDKFSGIAEKLSRLDA